MNPMNIEQRISELADQYANQMQQRIQQRKEEMLNDDTAHHLLYGVLGISQSESVAIDLYQNVGRFLYRYAGSFLESAVRICLIEQFPDAKFSIRIPNTFGAKPKTFEIDCQIGQTAYEVKWRDATTDGDHIIKEHTRLRSIVDAGLIPVRLMFYQPNRVQAIKIQRVLADMYKALNGEYYQGHDAWEYIHQKCQINLLSILENISEKRDI
jgi:hypothetical protein